MLWPVEKGSLSRRIMVIMVLELTFLSREGGLFTERVKGAGWIRNLHLIAGAR
jgi:hypothetical protein